MIELLRTTPLREQRQTIVPVILAAVVAIFAALVYLELVAILIEFLE